MITRLRPRRNLSFALASELRRSFGQDGFVVGGRLPAEPELARQFGVSRATVREAIAQLEEEGLVRRRQGAGTFLVGDVSTARNTLNINSGVTDLITAAGWVPGSIDVSCVLRAASEEEVNLLGLEPATQVVAIARTRTADGRPVVLARDVMAASLLGPSFSIERLAEVIVAQDSLYRTLEAFGLVIHHGEAEIRPAVATGEISRALGTGRGGLLLYIRQVDYLEDGTAVLLSHEYHMADAFTIRVYRKGPDRL